MHRTTRNVILVALFISACAALPLEDGAQSENTVSGKDDLRLMDKLNTRCSKREASACLMLKLVAYVDRLLKKADISVADGMQISQTTEVTEETIIGDARKSKTDEEAVGDYVAGKMWDFVKSRALRWELLPGAEVVLNTKPESNGELSLDLSLRESPKETGRGKMKNMGPIIAAGAMKIGMVGILAFKALALLVGKALLVSKLAFLLAAIIGLKKLFSQQKHVTYEVVAHPHHSHESHGGHDSYSSGWGRSIEVAPTGTPGVDAQNLAYKAHAQ